MALYRITATALEELTATTFAEAGVRERDDMQRLLRDNIGIVAPGCMVIAEEFGDWDDSKRRIDLLCIDRAANLVVIELKRTEDGGHMELQALRYAAMVSTMTFEQAVSAHAAYLGRTRSQATDAKAELLDFLGWEEPNPEVFGGDVRVVLASADFSKEVTTSVLWLNSRQLDIRCVRLKPYLYEGKVLLDVQQVIPLPEAADYVIRVARKEREERISRGRSRQRFDVQSPAGTERGLGKGRAILAVVRALVASGVDVGALDEVLNRPRAFLSAPGRLSPADFVSILSDSGRNHFDPARYYCADGELVYSDGQTFAFTNQWGIGTEDAMKALIDAFPDRGVSYALADSSNEQSA